jgi:hypothetical protein
MPIFKAFINSPDLKATESETSNNAVSYMLKWENLSESGKVFLKTLFYTPVNKSLSLFGESPESLEFYSANQSNEKQISLNGIQGMRENSETSFVESIEDVFKLVENGFACVFSSPEKTVFYWNEAELWKKNGSERSINELELMLGNEIACIN